MKILNYLKQLEKKENEKDDETRQEQLKLLKESAKTSELSRRVTYKFVKSIRETENIGGDILRLSKKAINSLINNKEDKAKIFLIEAFKKIESFDGIILELKQKIEIEKSKIEITDLQTIKINGLESSFLSAKEEYLEAKILFTYLKKGLIYKPKEKLLKDFEPYAGALSDFCGELLRKSRLNITKKDYSKKEIRKYYRDTKTIYQTLSVFSFSNKSGVRHKMEQLKDHMKGFEDILYDLRDK